MKKGFYIALGLSLTISVGALAQTNNTKYVFKDIKKIDATSVKDQNHTGTCWSFSTSSFLESELMRMGKGQYNLSEMFVVRKAYEEKAKRYVQMHGALNFGQGGEFHDVMRVIKEYGMMTRDAYPGKPAAKDKYRQFELEAVLKGMLDAVIKNPDGQLSPYWMDAVNGVLDAYLGVVPEKFNYNNKEYTAKSFAGMLGINPDDYIEITSVTNHPYNSRFINEIPDNWHWDEITNVSLDDMKEIVNNSVSNGYTVAWGASTAGPYFSYKNGVAVIPEIDLDDYTYDKRDSIIKSPIKQRIITPEIRQAGLENYTTQDDHGMHITGVAEDQMGDRFYLVKNSWGTKYGLFDGYLYASESYILAKTTGLMVNKNAIPKAIRKRMGIGA